MHFLKPGISDKQALTGGRLRARLIVTLFGVWLLSGCGGRSSGNSGQLRFVDASPAASGVNLLIDRKTLASNLVYSNSTDYLPLAAGSRRVQAIPVNGGSAIIDTAVAIGSGTYQTMLMTGPAAQIQSLLLTDGGTTASAGNGYVRLINASQAMGAADVYLVPAGSSIATVQPVAASLGFDKSTGYQLVAGGSFEVFMTAPGTRNVFLAAGPLTLTANQNQTVVVLDALAGGFTFTSLIDQ
ncbi:MAG: DUF4397 domain-containing protein [Acidobacteria bacterium]|nr:DUF4397 domain-containing protein [Acidobacteriota bacterium]